MPAILYSASTSSETCNKKKKKKKKKKTSDINLATNSDAIWKKHFCFFFEKNCFLWRKKHDLRKKHWKSVFFCFFFYNKLFIKEKTKVVFLIWGPGDPVCPREVKITPPTPSCSPFCGSVCGNWPNWGLLCKLVAKTFFFLCLYDVCC